MSPCQGKALQDLLAVFYHRDIGLVTRADVLYTLLPSNPDRVRLLFLGDRVNSDPGLLYSMRYVIYLGTLLML